MIHVGDCLEVMQTLDASSVDAIVSDPPYGLGFMGKAWDHAVPGVPFWLEMLRVAKPGAYLVAFGGTRTFHRMACAIEDSGWELRDTLSWCYASGFPKSHNLDNQRGVLFCGCESTTEREMRAVRDAHVPPALATTAGGGQVLLPCVPQPSASTAGREQLPPAEVRGEQPGVERRGDAQAPERQLHGSQVHAGARVGEADGASGRLHHGAPACDGADLRLPADANGSSGSPGPQPVEQSPVEPAAVSDECGSQEGGAWPLCSGCGKPRIPAGLGTALKPAWEPIILARKPLVGTVAANVLAYGTGALNIDGCRVGYDNDAPNPATNPLYRAQEGYKHAGNDDSGSTSFAVKGQGEPSTANALGRWPANLIHDGSDEVVACFPQSDGQAGAVTGAEPSSPFKNTYGDMGRSVASLPRGDTGSAARFFYCAKASREDRNDGCDGLPLKPSGMVSNTSGQHMTRRDGGEPGPAANNHPTVKPTDLMRWLCRLVTPPGGLVMDPFAGSGSTGRGAILEGFRFIGIELDPDYARIAEARIAAAVEQRRIDTAQFDLFAVA